MTKEETIKEYFGWLCNLICGNRYSNDISFEKLLSVLHNTEFVWHVSLDANRADDGVQLRRRFALEYSLKDVPDCLSGSCSILEMMVALAIRCEETIMDDPQLGDRTGQWFWSMIVNLGLGSMDDNRFDERYVDKVIATFLNQEYEADGKGGLFTVKNCEKDLRNTEIWFQMCRYLDTFMYLPDKK